MLQRTSKIFIGKDISRDAQVAAGANLYTITLSTGLADGEIVVLDKYKRVLAAGATVSDSDTIYIVQSTAATYAFSLPDGTAVTGARRVKMSDAIKGANVKSYTGVSYDAKSEQTIVFDLTAPGAVVVGTEYLLRVVYKDMNEHPGQFTATYRYTPTVVTLATFLTALTAKVNAHSGRRVQATCDATTITLTGLPIPGCTTGTSDLDEFSMVEFDAFLNYVDADGNWAEQAITSKTTTAADYGVGTWERVRDLEKACWGYEGITNRTLYPVILPIDTLTTETYDIITIEHDNDYLSPDNQYVKNTPLTTILAFAVPGTGTQETSVLQQLNPWMASLPGAFANVAV